MHKEITQGRLINWEFRERERHSGWSSNPRERHSGWSSAVPDYSVYVVECISSGINQFQITMCALWDGFLEVATSCLFRIHYFVDFVTLWRYCYKRRPLLSASRWKIPCSILITNRFQDNFKSNPFQYRERSKILFHPKYWHNHNLNTDTFISFTLAHSQ